MEDAAAPPRPPRPMGGQGGSTTGGGGAGSSGTSSPDAAVDTARGGSGGSGADAAAGASGDAAAEDGPTKDAAPGEPPRTVDAGDRDARLGPVPPPVGGETPACKFHFCDSFEQGSDGASPPGWSSNGAVVTASNLAARGKKSLRVRNGGINPGLFIARGGVFPPGKDTVYGRLMVRFEKRPGSGGLVHWTSVEVRGSGGPTVRAQGGISQFNFRNRNNLLFNIDPGGGEKALGDDQPYPTLPDNEWVCLEFMLTRGAKNAARTWWNDVPRPKLDYNGEWGSRFVFPTFSTLAIGFGTYQNVGAFEIYLDELVIHDQRVGCGP